MPAKVLSCSYLVRGLPLAAVLGLFSLQIASAQTISMTSPAAPQTVQEGDDFATSQLQNAWDFNERRDIGWEENFNGTSVQATNGVWSGTNAQAGGYVFPLFGGFKGTTYAEGLAGDKELPRFGINNPIDTSKYTLLSYRLNQTSRSTFAVYWKTDGSESFWPDGTQRGASYDGFYHASVGNPHSGYKIYSFDMSNLGSSFEIANGSWSGQVMSLRLDPSVFGPAGATLQMDWVRLVDPNSAPTLNVTWSSSGLSSNRLTTLWVDTDNSGFDGTPIKQFGDGSDPGSYSIKTAMFPPGDYYFYVTSHTGPSLTLQATSGYTARLRVTSVPSVTVTAPTQITGEDYANSVVGNPWDMSDSADISNLPGSIWPDQWRQFLNHSFTNGVFQAVADLAWTHIGNLGTDAQIHMNVPNTKPIDTAKYRYLTYRLRVDDANFPTINNKIEQGWVARAVFWNASFDNDGGSSRAHIVYEGDRTYTFDLWDSNTTESGVPWANNTVIKHLRLDPLETWVYTWFFYDDVKLSAENYATPSYTVRWNIADNDSSTFTTGLYYDTDKSGFNGTLITTLNGLSAGAQSYQWDTTGLGAGSRYFVYFVTSDGTNTTRTYADVPIVIGEYVATPRIGRAPLDYDGDGISDEAVYRSVGATTKKKVKQCKKKKGKKKCKWVTKTNSAGVGKFYVKQSVAGDYTQGWGGKNYRPVAGDFDGDNQADYGTIIANGSTYLWNIFLSFEKITYSIKWGVKGDRIAIGDYNGDGADDVAVWRDGTFLVYYRNGQTAAQPWGQAGDEPVPGDYDGDGKTDFAVWRPSDGNWWILNSSNGGVTQIQWGASGDKPVQADWDADGKTDAAVWRSSVGYWLIRETDSATTHAIQWGESTDKPIVGDFDGDGQLDLSVWRSSNATFYQNNRKGGSSSVQLGLKTDLLPVNDTSHINP